MGRRGLARDPQDRKEDFIEKLKATLPARVARPIDTAPRPVSARVALTKKITGRPDGRRRRGSGEARDLTKCGIVRIRYLVTILI